MKETQVATLEHVVGELDAIKRLLAFSLLRDGVAQQELAKALGVSQSSVSRMFSNAGRATGLRERRASRGGSDHADAE